MSGGWNLVFINSAAESAAIFSKIDNASLWKDLSPNANYLFGPYVGLFQSNDSLEPGTPAQGAAGGWRWVDGTTASYTSWFAGEPNNGGSCSSVTGVNNCDSVGSYFSFANIGRGSSWADLSVGPATIFINGYPVSNAGAVGADSESISFVVERDVVDVPAPLTVLGAAAAFGFSRKLRKRITANKAIGAPIIAE